MPFAPSEPVEYRLESRTAVWVVLVKDDKVVRSLAPYGRWCTGMTLRQLSVQGIRWEKLQ